MSIRKNDVEVIINNKIYTICGFESDEYIQRIASYINSKYSEFREMEGYNTLNTETKSILLEINIADDYFKAKKQGEEFLSDSEEKTREIFELKHDLITCQTKNDSLFTDREQLRDELSDAQKQIIKLETELEDYKKQVENLLNKKH